MRTLNEWFEKYNESHMNPINKAIHYVCVPVIYFSVIGFLMCIPNGFLIKVSPFKDPLIDNWAIIALFFVLYFYARLSPSLAIKMAVFSGICIIINFMISINYNLLKSSLVLFVLSWMGQFYGHKLEGKKPSFLTDLQFLLIGPAWVLESVFKRKNVE